MSQATQPCEYDPLTVMQKVEVFEMSLQHTAGQDLSKVLHLNGSIDRVRTPLRATRKYPLGP